MTAMLGSARRPVGRLFLAMGMVLYVGAWSGPAMAEETQDAWVSETFDAYESLRAALAQDRLDEVRDKAITVANAAGETRAPTVAKAAQSIVPSENADGMRKAFGDLSREMIVLAKEHPSAKKGRFVFTCGMAQGYPKWIQVSKTMTNPYMGQRMLECGTKSNWMP